MEQLKVAGIRESKIDGKLYLVYIGPNGPLDVGPFSALFHIFEHDYTSVSKSSDPRIEDSLTVIPFWHCAADVATTLSEMDKMVGHVNSGLPKRFWQDRVAGCFRIELDDGRRGFGSLKAIHERFGSGDSGAYLQIAINEIEPLSSLNSSAGQ